MSASQTPVQRPLLQSGIRDNLTRGSVGAFLQESIQPGAELAVVSAYFTIYAYAALRRSLDAIAQISFLFGEPRFINSLDPDKTEKKSFVIDADGLRLSNVLQQRQIARECAEWIREKVAIRSVRKANLLHGKMYHVRHHGVTQAILGSSNFTTHGLGLSEANNNIELNLVVDSDRDRQDLMAWFTDLWNDQTLVADVKQEVLDYLARVYANYDSSLTPATRSVTSRSTIWRASTPTTTPNSSTTKRSFTSSSVISTRAGASSSISDAPRFSRVKSGARSSISRKMASRARSTSCAPTTAACWRTASVWARPIRPWR